VYPGGALVGVAGSGVAGTTQSLDSLTSADGVEAPAPPAQKTRHTQAPTTSNLFIEALLGI
jgi:hypothetical protein